MLQKVNLLLFYIIVTITLTLSQKMTINILILTQSFSSDDEPKLSVELSSPVLIIISFSNILSI